jgi:hypothetical protein
MKKRIFILDPELQEIAEHLTPAEMHELAAELEKQAKRLQDVSCPMSGVSSPRIRQLLEPKFLRTALSPIKRTNLN